MRAKLDELGIADSTLVIFTSDHGSHFRTRNGKYKRACQWIPMVVFGPGFTGGRLIDELVSLIALPPSILQAGGAEVPDSMRRQPLQELIDGTATSWPEYNLEADPHERLNPPLQISLPQL